MKNRNQNNAAMISDKYYKNTHFSYIWYLKDMNLTITTHLHAGGEMGLWWPISQNTIHAEHHII